MEDTMSVNGLVLLEPLERLQNKIAEFEVNVFNHDISKYVTVVNTLNDDDKEAIDEAITIIKGREDSLISQEESDIINEHISNIVNKFIGFKDQFNFDETAEVKEEVVEDNIEEIELPTEETKEDEIQEVNFEDEEIQETAPEVNAFDITPTEETPEMIDTTPSTDEEVEMPEMIDTTPVSDENIDLNVEPVDFANEIDIEGLNALFDTTPFEEENKTLAA